MSVVIAVKHGGVVYMGADTQVTYGDCEKKNSTIESERKIFKFDNGLLLGSVGRGDEIMRLTYSKDIFTVPSEGLSKRYIVTEIVPKIFSFLVERKLLKEPEEDDETSRTRMRSSHILAYRDKIFYINTTFGVWECARFCVAGSGGEYAFPYLNTFNYEGDINGQILRAMKCCAKHDSSVSSPYIFINNKKYAFEVRE